jgi:hypothetical protein
VQTLPLMSADYSVPTSGPAGRDARLAGAGSPGVLRHSRFLVTSDSRLLTPALPLSLITDLRAGLVLHVLR